MSKAHRGSTLKKEIPRSGRGVCPVTHKSGVKLLFDYDIDGVNTKISKYGKAVLENRRLRQEKAAHEKIQVSAGSNVVSETGDQESKSDGAVASSAELSVD